MQSVLPGYESATEGDSFITSFHEPKSALLFALDVQVGDVLYHPTWVANI